MYIKKKPIKDSVAHTRVTHVLRQIALSFM